MVDAGARRFVSATDLGRGYSAAVSFFTGGTRPFAPPLPPWARSIAHILTLTASLASFSPPLFLTAQSAAPPAFAALSPANAPTATSCRSSISATSPSIMRRPSSCALRPPLAAAVGAAIACQ